MNIDKKRVLIVDDDSKSRSLFDAHMRSMGFETVLANNGEEAMEILATDSFFDLIITDIMMPYMTGFDFTKKLKEYTETKGIPVIATSAFHEWKKAREDFELVADGFVPKPVERNMLVAEISRLVK